MWLYDLAALGYIPFHFSNLELKLTMVIKY